MTPPKVRLLRRNKVLGVQKLELYDLAAHSGSWLRHQQHQLVADWKIMGCSNVGGLDLKLTILVQFIAYSYNVSSEYSEPKWSPGKFF